MTIQAKMSTVVPMAVGLLAQQIIEPFPVGIIERLGTVSILVVGSYYAVKYFMAQNEKKDQAIADGHHAHVDALERLHKEQMMANAAHTEMIVNELRESRAGREKLIVSVDAMTRSNEALQREVATLKVR